jgi:predicted TPR repeat methyltransferase
VLFLQPQHPRAAAKCASAYRQLKEPGLAIQYYEQHLQSFPDDEQSRFWLSILRNEQPDCAPASHVQSLFNSYADDFESHLVKGLKYGTPALLMHCLHQSMGKSVSMMRDWRVQSALDLGCGTGLMGELLRGHVTGSLSGVDLSEKMVEKARAKACYDHLAVGEMLAAMGESHAQHQLVLAADVVVYLGVLEPLFQAARRVAAPHAFFACSTETSASFTGPSYHACLTGRFKHHDDYVVRTAENCGWRLVQLNHETIRHKADQAQGSLCMEPYLSSQRIPVKPDHVFLSTCVRTTSDWQTRKSRHSVTQASR